MAKNEIFTCDICGAVRKEANHWFTAQRELVAKQTWLTLWPWPTGHKAEGNISHLCGESCVLKFVQQYMQEVKNSRNNL